MRVRSPAQLEGLKRAGRAASEALAVALSLARPGVSGLELDAAVRASLEAAGARPAAPLVYGFPGALCLSLSPAAAHGIPTARALQAGDLLNLDLVVELEGYYADTGLSLAVAPAPVAHNAIAGAAREVLAAAVAAIRPGMGAAELGALIEAEAARRGYRTLRDLAGHGIGRGPHEAPDFLECFPNPGNASVLEAGMVIAVEVFLSSRDRESFRDPDGWTLSTGAGNLVAQAEQSLLVGDSGVEILTPFDLGPP